MFFSIDDSIFNYLMKGIHEKEIDDVFKDLYNGLKKGNSVVSIESDIFYIYQSDILNSEKLSKDSRSLLYNCVDRMMYNQIIKKHISEFVNITLLDNVPKVQNIDGKISYQLNLLTLQKSDMSLQNKVTLLGEDISDCKFYEDFTNMYLNKTENPLKDLKISFRHSSGGGGSIGTVFESNIKHNNEITFAIADSDKFYPDEIKNDCTANHLKTSFNELQKLNNDGVFNYYILDVSEIENFISPKEYKKFHPKSPILDVLISIEDDPDYRHYLKFYDMKYGLSKKIWFKNQKYQEYYKPLLTKYPELICVNKEALDDENLCTGKHITYSGGKDILKKVSLENIINFQPSYLNHEILEFIKRISSWGVGTGTEIFII